jgi:hypothetical protein
LKKVVIIILVLCAAVSALVLAGCGASPGPDGSGAGQDNLPVMGRVDRPLAVDGLSEGYPASPLQVAGVEIFLASDGTVIYVHARAQADGWIAVGFNQRGRGMDGSNIILGAVDENGDIVARNDLGRGIRHDPAAADGIIEAVVILEDGYLTLEFSYPAEFPDQNGFALGGITFGEVYSLIAAVHNRSASITQKHTSRGQVDFRAE